MSDKEHCRACGAELVECDGCHGSGMMHFDGPLDSETGYVGYDEPCSECSGRGGYAAPLPAPVAAPTPETDGAAGPNIKRRAIKLLRLDIPAAQKEALYEVVAIVQEMKRSHTGYWADHLLGRLGMMLASEFVASPHLPMGG